MIDKQILEGYRRFNFCHFQLLAGEGGSELNPVLLQGIDPDESCETVWHGVIKNRGRAIKVFEHLRMYEPHWRIGPMKAFGETTGAWFLAERNEESKRIMFLTDNQFYFYPDFLTALDMGPPPKRRICLDF